MLRVRLILDPLDLSSYEEHTPKELLPFLREKFPTWPPTARLYREQVAQECDVTPVSQCEVDQLTDDGLYYVVVYPGDPITLIIITVGIFVVALAAMILLMPKPPGINNQSSQSSNNSLGNRVNKARPNERVPDIFGRIKAVPELLTAPLVMFENNREFELCYMCIGRGEYELDEDFVFDGQTPLANMAGGAADFYGPFTRPGNGDPILEIGGGIGFPLKNVLRLNEVNGQALKPPNAGRITGQGNIKLVGPASIVANPASSIDFTRHFQVGDDLTMTNAAFGGVAVFDATSQVCRFYADKSIEFETFNPSTLYTAGDSLVIYNGQVTGIGSGGALINIDVSGTYVIASVTATKIFLV